MLGLLCKQPEPKQERVSTRREANHRARPDLADSIARHPNEGDVIMVFSKHFVAAGVAALLAAGCASNPDPNSLGARLQARGGATAELGERWTAADAQIAEGRGLIARGENRVEDGERLVDRGEDMIDDGEADVSKGRRLIREGEAERLEVETEAARRGLTAS
jgi:hypothetical protein